MRQVFGEVPGSVGGRLGPRRDTQMVIGLG